MCRWEHAGRIKGLCDGIQKLEETVAAKRLVFERMQAASDAMGTLGQAFHQDLQRTNQQAAQVQYEIDGVRGCIQHQRWGAVHAFVPGEPPS